ncbi:AMP deaminase-like [Malania oleifera]|uniref:AMP deaminase-like n=1 Tax=Malania oleifera TaxID=397392 RepID=UPI0025AE1691|nr:AMP deaminase-like [Malania oleifera]
MDSSSSPASSLHLAMAALIGASVMAISAFYIHKRSVDQVLRRLIDIRRKLPPDNAGRRSELRGREEDEEEEEEEEEEKEERMERDFDGFGSDEEIEIDGKMLRQALSRSAEHTSFSYYRASSSLPNLSVSNHWLGGDAKFRQPGRITPQVSSSSFDKLDLIPSGLTQLQTTQRNREDHMVNPSASTMSVASVGRLMTPRSPGGNAFGNGGDSDDEVTEPANGEDIVFSYDNINSSADFINGNGVNLNVDNSSIDPFKADISNYFQDQEGRMTVGKEKAGVELHGNGKVDADRAPVHSKENDPVSAHAILPPRTAVHESGNIEEEEVRKMIRECLDLRESYVYKEKVAPWEKEPVAETTVLGTNNDPFHFSPVEATAHCFRMEDGVVHVYASENDTVDLFPVSSSTTFFTDMHHLLRIISIGNVRSACHHRLRFLEEKFRLHLLVNADREFLAQKSAPHRDFYNIRKVDTHVHHSACMNQKHLLRFIKSKLRKEHDEVVIFRDGKYLTLKEVFESLDLTGHDLSVDLLDVHADKSTFHRFDKFNLKYNPCGQSRLREIFLKQDNLIQGRFLAEVTKEVLLDLEASKYQMAEYRLSIYGRKQSEWDQLASWVVNNAIYSENAVWFIQLPRLYNVYKKMGIVTSFQNILDNVFIPLFEVSIDPSSHPHLHLFLNQVVGFDIVDDESKPERRPTKHMPKPAEWTNEFNPAYSYYAYYCYANLYVLNKVRESKRLPTIKFRPHCGEAGDIDHLAAAFLLCHNISHGINLRKSPVLQYLYYLAQIGLAMSPLSNNSLFLDYHRNPFIMFFQRGLNVSLSTDDPLQIHLTKEPLVEEYSVAAKVWKLSACDLCEIARNSVYQSGFSHVAKLHWLGGKYFVRGPGGNDIHKTNVPNIRIAFRHETWKEEMQYVYSGKARFPEEIDL